MKFSPGKPKPLKGYKLMTSVMKYSRSHQLFLLLYSRKQLSVTDPAGMCR